METKNKKMKYRNVFLGLAIAGMMISCGSDDDGNGGGDNGNPNAPTISLTTESSVLIKPGESVSVTLELNATGGNQQLLVYANGGILEEVPLDNDITSYTYTNQTIAADTEEGTVFAYEFALEDDSNQVSERVPFTANVAVYDQIEIEGQSLFNVDIPENGIVTDGTSIVFSEDRDYYISSKLTFLRGSSLTIKQGATVYLKTPEAATDPTIEIPIVAGVSLSIIGTETNPIVMAPSSVLTGDPKPGDWDRLYLNGATVDAVTLNGAVIRYLRTEYATQGLRVNEVDDTNTLEYIQSYKSNEEGIYFTNGNANAKYLVVTDSEDTGYRLGDSYEGKIQFGIGISSVPLGAYQVQIRDEAKPLLANFTAIGAGSEENSYGFRFRGPSDGRVYNSIGAAFSRRGIRLNDDLTVDDEVNAGEELNGPTVFAYSYIFDIGNTGNNRAFEDDREIAETDPDPVRINPFYGYIDVMDEFQNPFNNNITGLTFVENNDDGLPLYIPTLETIPGIGVNDFIPDATVTAKENHDPSTVDTFFTSVTYVGAIENEAGDWTVGWVKNPDGTIR